VSGHGFLLGFGCLEKVKNHWTRPYLHSFKLQFTIDGTGNKVLSVFHTIVDPRTKVIPGRLLFREVSPKKSVGLDCWVAYVGYEVPSQEHCI